MAQTVYDLALEDTSLKRASRGRYQGPCPSCGGTDRFYVNLNHDSGEPRWGCNHCHPAESEGWGDAIDYLRIMRGMTFHEAKDFLSREIDQARQNVDKVLRRVEKVRGAAPSEDWQERNHKSVMTAQERLFSDVGREALAYLHSRGLEDKTIKRARLGYATPERPETKQSTPCVVIPWYSGTTLWRVRFRSLLPDCPKKERYFYQAGSANGALYLEESLQRREKITVLVEGEIDALTIAQECADLVNVVATGSITGARLPKLALRLARCPGVLVTFDNEEKVEQHAQWWLDRLTNARRYRPLLHDVNDMHMAGLSVREWIEATLEQAELTPEEKAVDLALLTSVQEDRRSDQLAQTTDDGISLMCTICGAEVDGYTDAGVPLCKVHFRARIVARFTEELAEWNVGKQHFSPHFKVEVRPGVPEPHASSPASADRRYKPVELPALDRPLCPHTVFYETDRKGHAALVKTRKCNARAAHSGWCAEHQYSALLLDLGAQLGYPEVRLNDYITLKAGVTYWEEHARMRSRQHLLADLPIVKQFHTHEKERQS